MLSTLEELQITDLFAVAENKLDEPEDPAPDPEDPAKQAKNLNQSSNCEGGQSSDRNNKRKHEYTKGSQVTKNANFTSKNNKGQTPAQPTNAELEDTR